MQHKFFSQKTAGGRQGSQLPREVPRSASGGPWRIRSRGVLAAVGAAALVCGVLSVPYSADHLAYAVQGGPQLSPVPPRADAPSEPGQSGTSQSDTTQTGTTPGSGGPESGGGNTPPSQGGSAPDTDGQRDTDDHAETDGQATSGDNDAERPDASPGEDGEDPGELARDTADEGGGMMMPMAEPGTGPQPFDPDLPYIFVAQDRPTTKLYQGRQSAGALSLPLVGVAETNVGYNAVGYNTHDNFMYGIRAHIGSAPGAVGRGTNDLVRIGVGGVTEVLGEVTSLSEPGGEDKNSYTQGTFGDLQPTGSTPGNTHLLYVRDNANSSHDKNMWAVDVATKTAVKLDLSEAVTGIADMTASGPYIWAFNRSKIYRMTIVPGSTNVAVRNWDNPLTAMTANLSSGQRNYGGAWTWGNGDFGFHENITGEVFRVRITNPAANEPIFTQLAKFIGPPSSNNDATNVVGLDVDLAIEKTGAQRYTRGGNMSYTLTVTNNGPGISSGSVVTDPLPATLLTPSSPTPGCTVLTGNRLECVLGELAVGDSTELVVNTTVVNTLPTPAHEIVNEATVTGNEFDPDLSNNTDDTAAIPRIDALAVTKSAVPASLQAVNPGQLVTYTVQFDNQGNVPAPVNHADVLDDVLDDATLEGSIVTTNGLQALRTQQGEREVILITGTLAPSGTATVSYSFRVHDTLQPPANSHLGNFVVLWGDDPPTVCAPTSTLCTEHPILGSLQWNKVNAAETKQRLGGSEWRLTQYSAQNPTQLDPSTALVITDCVAETAEQCTAPGDVDPQSGSFTLRGLSQGDYLLEETKAPAGYLIGAPVPVTITGTVTLGDLENTQSEGPTLPLTGGIGAGGFAVAAAALAAAVASGIWFQRRRRSVR